MSTVPVAQVSFDEYLDIEERSPIRHELVGGQLYAMTGATKRHNQVSLRIRDALAGALGNRCRA